MQKFLICLVAGALVASLGLGISSAQDAKAPTIKQVMKTAHKEGLLKKVATGKASDAEKKQLVTLYEALAAAKPPKGDEASWKEKTAAMVEAAKAADATKLKTSTNCKACHSAHKPK